MTTDYNAIKEQVGISLFHLYIALEKLDESDSVAIMINGIARDLSTVDESLEMICGNMS